jgi:nucleophosmin 3
LCQVFLGEGTVKDEEQIVEVFACGKTGKLRMPIARLQGGLVENFPLKIKFSNSPVIFKLIKGSGPVHLIGIHIFGKLDPLRAIRFSWD